jgi:hypothetical protein
MNYIGVLQKQRIYLWADYDFGVSFTVVFIKYQFLCYRDHQTQFLFVDVDDLKVSE